MALLETDSGNFNIATGTVVGSFTADAYRVMQLRAFGTVAASGSYSGWITIQRLGAGAFTKTIPITTETLNVGEPDFSMLSIPYPVNATDVIQLYMKGRTVDTNVATIVEWHDVTPLQPTTHGRFIDVDASGGVEVGSFQNNALTASAIATDAITADKIAANAITSSELDASAVTEIQAGVFGGIIEGTYDLQEMLRLIAAVLFGKSAGGGTATITFRDTGDTKDRITATVDVNGNRSVVTLDET